MINSLAGLVDKETLVAQLSFVSDAKEVVKTAEEEEDKKDKKLLEFGGYGTLGQTMVEDTPHNKEAPEDAE